MKTLLQTSSITLIFLLLSCCGGNIETIQIKEVSKSQNYILNFEIGENEIADKIKLEIYGNVNDTAKLGHNYIMPGKVDTTFKYDWYANQYVINYKSYKATDGYLRIKARLIAY